MPRLELDPKDVSLKDMNWIILSEDGTIADQCDHDYQLSKSIKRLYLSV